MFWIVPAEGSPKISIHRPKIAGLPPKTPRVFFVCPLFPNVHTARAQVCLVRVARQEPKQFFGNPTKGNSFGRDDRKTFAQIETRLKSEVRDRADTGAVLMFDAAVEDRAKN